MNAPVIKRMRLQPWHRVGQIVVCIDPTPVPNPRHPRLTLREVLDIAAVHVSPRGWAYLAFAQHDRPGGPPFFGAANFRPVAPTSIASLLEAVMERGTPVSPGRNLEFL